VTLSDLVGTKVRIARDHAGSTQDDVARAARLTGLGWGRSTIADLERGKKRLSAEELLLLPLLFSLAFDIEASLEWILRPTTADEPGPWVQLTDDARIRHGGVAAIISRKGDWTEHYPGAYDIPATEPTHQPISERAPRLKELRNRYWPAADLASIAAAERASMNDAEQKAARRLTVPAVAISIAAVRKWGHSLTEERMEREAERLPPDADGNAYRGVRGHVTRELMAELEPSVIRGDE
jgi:transcriptional regulator with XRE-family HTH domain